MTLDCKAPLPLPRSLALAALAVPVLGLAACAPGEDATPAPEPVPEYTIEQFMGNTSVAGLSFSPDGSKVLVSTDASGIFNAYAYPVDGGEPTQLTDSTTDAVFAVGYMPDGERILYAADQGGDELDHLYLRGADGTVTDLTPGDGHKAQFYQWSHDDASFFVGSNERDPRFFDVYEYPVDALERKLFYQNDEGLEFGGVSPDRRYVALAKPYSTSDSDVFLLDRAERRAHQPDRARGPGVRGQLPVRLQPRRHVPAARPPTATTSSPTWSPTTSRPASAASWCAPTGTWRGPTTPTTASTWRSGSTSTRAPRSGSSTRRPWSR